jgi:Glycosyltransferase like family 2
VSAPLQISYVLPLRMADARPRAELAAYLRELVAWCEQTIVVDGSDAELFAGNAAAWPAGVRHLAPDPAYRFLSGKVDGVRTGVDTARCEHVVIADDDVRYRPEQLARIATLLETHDLVRPQNVFDALPWHARWDTARTLLNRSLGADYPGTLAVRRSRFVAMGGYDGDVLFENLELIRTVRAHGGSVASPLDLCVARRPPDAARFWSQRTRQAYDDFALPLRMACWLAIAPLTALALARRRPGAVAAGAVACAGLAERGRRRAGGREAFPASSSLLAPVWIAERAVCSWLALLQRLRFGGVRYNGVTIPVAAHSLRTLRRRARAVTAARPAPAAPRHSPPGAAERSAPLSA